MKVTIDIPDSSTALEIVIYYKQAGKIIATTTKPIRPEDGMKLEYDGGNWFDVRELKKVLEK